MPETIQPTHFEVLEFPKLRFIGVDAWRTQEDWASLWQRQQALFAPLDALRGQISPVMPHRVALMHHDNGEVDVVNRYLVGRFFLPDTTVPPGYDVLDLPPQTVAYATFDNVTEDTLWQRYACVRDRILSDGVGIPYPVGYWHAEVYENATPADPIFNCGVLFSCRK